MTSEEIEREPKRARSLIRFDNGVSRYTWLSKWTQHHPLPNERPSLNEGPQNEVLPLDVIALNENTLSDSLSKGRIKLTGSPSSQFPCPSRKRTRYRL